MTILILKRGFGGGGALFGTNEGFRISTSESESSVNTVSTGTGGGGANIDDAVLATRECGGGVGVGGGAPLSVLLPTADMSMPGGGGAYTTGRGGSASMLGRGGISSMGSSKSRDGSAGIDVVVSCRL